MIRENLEGHGTCTRDLLGHAESKRAPHRPLGSPRLLPTTDKQSQRMLPVSKSVYSPAFVAVLNVTMQVPLSQTHDIS